MLSKSSTLTTQVGKISGVYAAYAPGNYEIVDENFVAIHCHGISFSQTVYTTIEAGVGDLAYIDGCGNSNIISPPRLGSPV